MFLFVNENIKVKIVCKTLYFFIKSVKKLLQLAILYFYNQQYNSYLLIKNTFSFLLHLLILL